MINKIYKINSTKFFLKKSNFTNYRITKLKDDLYFQMCKDFLMLLHNACETIYFWNNYVSL